MRKQKLLKKSSRRGNLLAALLMVTASLLLGTSAYARVFTKGETIYVNTKYHKWFNNDSYYPTLSSSSSSGTEFAQASAYSSDKFYTLEVAKTTDDLSYIYIERYNGSSWNNKYKFAVGEGNEIVLLSNQNDNEWLGNWRTYDSDPTAYNVWIYTASTTPKVYAYLSKGESELLGAWSGTEAPLDASNNYSWHKVALPADIYDLKYKLFITDNGSAKYPAETATEFDSKDAIMWYYNDNGTGKGGIKDISKYQFYFDDASTLDPTAFKAVNPQYGFYATINLASGAHKQ